MREPRYPLPRVVLIFERVRRMPKAHRFRGLWQRALFSSYSLALPAPGLVIVPLRGWFERSPPSVLSALVGLGA